MHIACRLIEGVRIADNLTLFNSEGQHRLQEVAIYEKSICSIFGHLLNPQHIYHHREKPFVSFD